MILHYLVTISLKVIGIAAISVYRKISLYNVIIHKPSPFNKNMATLRNENQPILTHSLV